MRDAWLVGQVLPPGDIRAHRTKLPLPRCTNGSALRSGCTRAIRSYAEGTVGALAVGQLNVASLAHGRACVVYRFLVAVGKSVGVAVAIAVAVADI